MSPAGMVLPLVLLIPAMGILDKTLYLACRAEHYFVVLVFMALAPTEALWIAGAKLVWCFIWFWAATSKLNHHFPNVVTIMVSNSPILRVAALERGMYRHHPDDLSRLGGQHADLQRVQRGAGVAPGSVDDVLQHLALELDAGLPETVFLVV